MTQTNQRKSENEEKKFYRIGYCDMRGSTECVTDLD